MRVNPRQQTVAVLGPLCLVVGILVGLLAHDPVATGIALAGMGWSWILAALGYDRQPVNEPPGLISAHQRTLLKRLNLMSAVALAVAFGFLVAGTSDVLPYIVCGVVPTAGGVYAVYLFSRSRPSGTDSGSNARATEPRSTGFYRRLDEP